MKTNVIKNGEVLTPEQYQEIYKGILEDLIPTGGNEKAAKIILANEISDIFSFKRQTMSKWAKGMAITPTYCLAIQQILREHGRKWKLSDIRPDLFKKLDDRIKKYERGKPKNGATK